MIPLVDVPEQSFGKLEELRDTIASQDRKVYDVPIRKVSLNEDGTLLAGKFEGPLTKPALWGLLNTEDAPADFVVNRCPEDLLVTIVRRLACEQNTCVVIQSIDGVATGIMPVDRQPIRHDTLIDWLGVDRPIKEAALSADCLRITAVSEESKKLLPNDKFGFGWELITSEHGWRSTEVWRWAVRELCTNGLVGFDKTPVFKRTYNSRKPVLISLEGLLYLLEKEIQPPELRPAIKWAADRRIGREAKPVVSYLSQRLGGDATRLELRGMTESTSWYELMNTITSIARLHSLELRRRYEVEGGKLLNWFSRQGRGKPPWHRISCDECEAWNVSKVDKTG